MKLFEAVDTLCRMALTTAANHPGARNDDRDRKALEAGISRAVPVPLNLTDEPVVVNLRRAPISAPPVAFPGPSRLLPPFAALGQSAKTLPGFLAFAALALFIAPSSIMAQSVRTPVNLGTAGNFVILSKSGITDVPPSAIVGNIGASPITGAAIHVTCSEVTGTIYAVDAAGPAPCAVQDSTLLGTAIGDMATAYTDAAGRTIPDFTNLGTGNISGMTLVPGLYKWTTGVSVDNTGVTLSGGPNAVWIFQISGDVTLASNAHVNLTGGAQANNVFWQIGGGAGLTLGTGAVFYGNALSATAVIMNTGASLIGRALAVTDVTLDMSPGTSPGPLVGGVPAIVPPTVTSTAPASHAPAVPVNSALTATFSEAMDPATITSLTFTVANGLTPVTGAVVYSGVTATFTPSSTLPPGTLLTATITTGAKDPQGVALAANYVWTFTTAATPDTTPPTVSSTIPASGATNVPVGNALTATFSEAMNPLTITTTTFTLKHGSTPVLGTVIYSGVTATFTPSTSLAPSTLFTATITTGVTDLAGNALVSTYTWTFTTGATPDTTPPTVSSTAPANGATNVPVGNALTATFSEAMNPLTITTTTFTLKQGSTPVLGAVIYSGVTATFTPLSSLAPNVPFTATITTGVTDLAGNALVTNYVWTFTSGATPDTTPPTVSSTVPLTVATNVPVGNALTATFSEAMNPLTITTTTFTLRQGSTPVLGAVIYSGVTATFTPLTSLAPNAPFTATITTGVTDLAGNALVTNYVWAFTTGATPDTTPPTVSSTVPAAGATSVPVGNALTVTFSEAMNPLTVTATTFTLKQGSTPVLGAVIYSGVTATFTPLGSLAPNVPFTATITTGVTDLAGNALVSNYVWTFTTGATPDTTPPIVSYTAPVAGTVNVPVGNALSATFDEAMNPLTVTTTTFTLRQGSAFIPGSVVYSGVTATFMPLSRLVPNAPFTATVTTGATDLAGNALVSNYTWTFTTGATVDTAPPTVISTLPPSGAVLVTATTNVVANFSELMNPLTISTATFLLRQGTTPVPGTVTYAGTSATFRPLNNLAPNTLYSATITSAAADLAGNLLQSNYTWSFNTGTSTGQTPVCLANFAVLAGSTIINSGPTVVTGDIGVSPGTSITGFPPGTFSGTIHAGDAIAAKGMADVTAAYADAVARSVGPVTVTGDIGGQTFTAGLYQSLSSLQISSGDLILDAKGNINAVFIFQVASTLTTAAGRSIVLAGGTQAFNVFWQVGTSATLGANSVFLGSILADQSITLGAGATVNGRLAALNGAITLNSNTVTSPPPYIALGGIYNAASWAPTVAAGSIAAVFGNNLASSLTSATAFPLSATLGGTSFQVGNVGSPLYMTSCSQANLQIPWESAGQTQAPVTATAGGLVSLPQNASLATFSPGIFSLNMLGTGQGAVEIAPTAVLAAPQGTGARPVMRGEYIAIFCTGLGPVSNQPATGAPGLSSPLSITTTLPVVTIGGAAAQVSYSGLAPGFAGLYQVNAVVPDAALSGNAVNLVISIGGVQSNTVTIAVQ